MEGDGPVSKEGNLTIPHLVRKEDPARTVEADSTDANREALNGIILQSASQTQKVDSIRHLLFNSAKKWDLPFAPTFFQGWAFLGDKPHDYT